MHDLSIFYRTQSVVYTDETVSLRSDAPQVTTWWSDQSCSATV